MLVCSFPTLTKHTDLYRGQLEELLAAKEADAGPNPQMPSRVIATLVDTGAQTNDVTMQEVTLGQDDGMEIKVLGYLYVPSIGCAFASDGVVGAVRDRLSHKTMTHT
jgi:hypothetical protein